ncbi:hypothetical protein MY11210_008442 [Beauveria gryllotalpidicola]
MRYHRTSKGLWAFLVLSCFAVLSSCYRNGDHELVLIPFHRASIINRAILGSAATTTDDDYDSPAEYDFSNTDTTTASTAAYPLPTATLGGGAGDPSSSPSLTLDRHSSTATTEPRSPGMSNGPEIESTSTAVSQESSNGETLSSSTTSVSDTSHDPVSQTDAHLDETVTITVTNFVSSSSKPTEISYPISTSSDMQNSVNSSSSAASDVAISVITITSLHTITLSISHNSSSSHQTTLQLSTSPENVTSTAGTISSQNSTSMVPITSSGVSIITITRTETYTGMSNTTADATAQATSKEVATSTIDWPTPISRIPPFSASFNLSSVPGPVISSQVSGAATSLQSTSPSSTTRTVFQNITVTLSEFPDTGSRETEATSTAVPTIPASSNATDSVSSTRFISTLYPVPSSAANLSSTKAPANATDARSSSMSISTEVITITVYPTTLETGDPANVTSVMTLHSNSTTTVVLTPYPLSNVNSSTLPTPEGRTTASSGLLNTGSAGGWSTNLPTASANSSVIGTRNTTTAWSSTDYTHPTYIDTTCEHTDTTSQPAATAGTGAGNSSSSMGTSLNRTKTNSLPSTFKTTVSRTPSVQDDGASAYPSASGKRLPGSPSYPWGGSGPLHRLQEPDF